MARPRKEQANKQENKTVNVNKNVKDSKFKRIVVEPNLGDIEETGFMYQGEILPFGHPILADDRAIEAILSQKIITRNKSKKITPYMLAQEKGISIDQAVEIINANKQSGDNILSSEELQSIPKYRIEYLKD